LLPTEETEANEKAPQEEGLCVAMNANVSNAGPAKPTFLQTAGYLRYRCVRQPRSCMYFVEASHQDFAVAVHFFQEQALNLFQLFRITQERHTDSFQGL
jgi:hypothetical protein